MREWINLMERAAPPFELTDEFCAAIHEYIDEYLGDWSDDFADPETLRSALEPIVRGIFDEAHSGMIPVYREELRPMDQIENDSYGTLGHCWSWDANCAQVCHHDNAYEDHGGRENVHPVMFDGKVRIEDVEWVQTLAKNLILKNEREISIREGAIVSVEEVWTKANSKPTNFNIEIVSSGDF